MAKIKLRAFNHYLEDMECKYCLNYKGKNKLYSNGCQRDICEFISERWDAIKNGRYKREKNWDK